MHRAKTKSFDQTLEANDGDGGRRLMVEARDERKTERG